MTIHKITYLYTRRGSQDYLIGRADLVFKGDCPLIVLEWKHSRDGDEPLWTIPLEKEHLEQLTFDGPTLEFSYDPPVEDPRALD